MFKVSKASNGNLFVTTEFNNFFLVVDKVKGIGIYHELETSNVLIKSYRHTKTETAIIYLFKEYFLN